MRQTTFPLKQDVPITWGQHSSLVGSDTEVKFKFKEKEFVADDDGFRTNTNVVIGGDLTVEGNITYEDMNIVSTSDNLILIGAGTQDPGYDDVGIINQVQYSDINDLGTVRTTKTVATIGVDPNPSINRIYLSNTENVNPGDMVTFSELTGESSVWLDTISKVRSVGLDYIELFQPLSKELSSVLEVEITPEYIRVYFNGTPVPLFGALSFVIGEEQKVITVSTLRYSQSEPPMLAYDNSVFPDMDKTTVADFKIHTPSQDSKANFYDASYNAIYFNKSENKFLFNNVKEDSNGSLTPINACDIAAGGASFSKFSEENYKPIVSITNNSNTSDSSVISLTQENPKSDFLKFSGSSGSLPEGGAFVGSIVSANGSNNVIAEPTYAFLKIYLKDTSDQLEDGDYYIPIYKLKQS